MSSDSRTFDILYSALFSVLCFMLSEMALVAVEWLLNHDFMLQSLEVLFNKNNFNLIAVSE